MPGGEIWFRGEPNTVVRLQSSPDDPVGLNYLMNEGTIRLRDDAQVRVTAEFNNYYLIDLASSPAGPGNLLSVEGGGRLSGGALLGVNANLDVVVSEAKYNVTLDSFSTAGSGAGSLNLTTLADGGVYVDGGGGVQLQSNVTLRGTLDGNGEGAVLEIGTVVNGTGQLRTLGVSTIRNGLQVYVHSGGSMIIGGLDLFLRTASSIENHGRVYWTTALIHSSNGQVDGPAFLNAQGARFEVLSDTEWRAFNAAFTRFVNHGRIIKHGGTTFADREDVP